MDELSSACYCLARPHPVSLSRSPMPYGNPPSHRGGRLQPFLRWVGGKRNLAGTIVEHLPDDFESRIYIEPFLGSGTLFFATEPSEAILGDLNGALIAAFRSVKRAPLDVNRGLIRHMAHNSAEYYTRIRRLNHLAESTTGAARFIYLNATGFNGVYRVNKQGKYNVPYGKRHRALAPSPAHLTACSEALKSASLLHADYHATLSRATSDSFVYLDPPYLLEEGANGFTHYTRGRFSVADHALLAEHVRELHERGALVMLSNIDSRVIRRLYKGFRFVSLPVTRFVSGAAKRVRTSELLITNY